MLKGSVKGLVLVAGPALIFILLDGLGWLPARVSELVLPFCAAYLFVAGLPASFAFGIDQCGRYAAELAGLTGLQSPLLPLAVAAGVVWLNLALLIYLAGKLKRLSLIFRRAEKENTRELALSSPRIIAGPKRLAAARSLSHQAASRSPEPIRRARDLEPGQSQSTSQERSWRL